MRVAALLTLLVLAAGCARAPRPTAADSRHRASAARSAPARTAADSASVRRLCEAPDSVLAGRAPCVLRDQAAFHVF